VARTDKPIAIAVNYSLVRHEHIALRLTQAGVPVLDGTAEALRAVKHALAYRDFQKRVDAADASPVSASTRQLWCDRLAAGDLGESDALDLLDAYGIATPPRRHAASRADAIPRGGCHRLPGRAQDLRLPASPTRAMSAAFCSTFATLLAVGMAYDDLALRLGPRVLVQAMVGKGVEAALGAVNDPDFGPYAMVAAGGILIELIEDRAVSLAPMSRAKASELIDRLRLRRVLAGLRGAPPADAAALADALWRLSQSRVRPARIHCRDRRQSGARATGRRGRGRCARRP
jgi:acyl-CoA synthetase (NDP forming)